MQVKMQLKKFSWGKKGIPGLTLSHKPLYKSRVAKVFPWRISPVS